VLSWWRSRYDAGVSRCAPISVPSATNASAASSHHAQRRTPAPPSRTLATATAMPTANWSRKFGSGSIQRVALAPNALIWVELTATTCQASDAANRAASATNSLRTPPRGDMRRTTSAHSARKM